MNAIFGLINLDGAPAADYLDAMQAALHFWSRDGAVWSDGPCGLGCLHLPVTTEAAWEHLPLHDPASGLVLSAGARLDNRDELIDQLYLESGRQAKIADPAIILHAYQRWGESCVHYLEGAWHFAIWDERNRRLFLARDHHNNTGLYTYRGPRCFAFASTKKALLALACIPQQPNLLRVAQVLAAWPGDGLQTGYEQIRRLPPAHWMVVSPTGQRIERYWSPENLSELRLKSDDEYVEAFLEAFTRAVSVRLRSRLPIGVTLSGGLDSGSLTAVAASLLSQPGQELTAFTSVPLSDPNAYTNPQRFGDESHLAQEVARQAGVHEHVLIDAGEIAPLAGIERMLWVHDEPGHAAGNQFWIEAILQSARQRGMGVLLTGQMGNAVISWAGGGENFIPQLMHSLLPFRARNDFWTTFEKARRRAGLDRWQAVRRFLLKPLLLPLLFDIQTNWPWQRRAWQAYSALRPAFAREIGLNEKMALVGYLPGLRSPDSPQQRLATLQPGRSILGATWLEKGSAYGLEVRDPTQDRRLIELCLAIPDSQYQRDGRDRWLIRRAMQGFLPDSVRLNTRRGLQAADLGHRILASRGEIEAALTRLGRHDLALHVLDLPRMRKVLTSLERGATPQNHADCNTILLRGLMAGLFLLRF